MKIQSVFFEKRAILNFLRAYGKGPGTKHYELLAALIIARFCEEQWKAPALIGFQIKDKFADSKHHGQEYKYTPAQVKEFLEKQVETDTPIDVLITQGTIPNWNKKAPAFQLKTFGYNTGKSSGELVNYLNSLSKKYAKTNTGLFLILAKGVEIDFSKITKGIDTETFPFNSIRYMGMNSDKLLIGEFWPASGVNEYDPQALVNEGNI